MQRGGSKPQLSSACAVALAQVHASLAVFGLELTPSVACCDALLTLSGGASDPGSASAGSLLAEVVEVRRGS